jgi:aldose sugar dehydrogenase
MRPWARAVSIITLVACDSATAGNNPSPNAELATDVIATGLATVWELAWGPDGFIWVTERGGRISRMNPETGARTTVAQLDVAENGEGGLMGFTFHPDFPAQPWVYAAHTYHIGNDETQNRIVRMRFNGTTLDAPQSILEAIPGSSIHNGSRLAIGPDRFLYVTTGDASNASIAQNRDNLAGKILRLTLDGQPAPGNPFGTRIYSYGHRNPQGLVFAPDGSLYATEHGPSENDEVNRIEAGKNYGWPNVHGRCDGDIPNEESFCSANAVVEPIAMWTPTIAPAGAVYYDHALIPAFRRSILFATLKDATLYRLALSPDGRSVESTEQLFVHQFGRLRAVLVAPDGSIYLGTSNRDGRGTPMPTDDRIIRIRPR